MMMMSHHSDSYIPPPHLTHDEFVVWAACRRTLLHGLHHQAYQTGELEELRHWLHLHDLFDGINHADGYWKGGWLIMATPDDPQP
jgi:hypothetical protein